MDLPVQDRVPQKENHREEDNNAITSKNFLAGETLYLVNRYS
jgi:hypothetical protein